MDFLIINEKQSRELLQPDEGKGLIAAAYNAHKNGITTLPHSLFLRPNATNRIIALPAYIGGSNPSIGIKWVSSFPENVYKNLNRASAIVILNDTQNGYPIACISANYINLFRTCISALLVADQYGYSYHIQKIGILGAGAMANCFLELLPNFKYVSPRELLVYDQYQQQATALTKEFPNLPIVQASFSEVLNCDLVIIATTAAKPYITAENSFKQTAMVLNISLRDISPDIILNANNLVDDIDHVNREGTSIHLAASANPSLNFINGTIADYLFDNLVLPPDKPTILSPFGLGILDLAIANYIYQKAKNKQIGITINNFNS